MLKEDKLIGALIVYRQEVRPFTDKQTELVKNFAAQAVIAIENARLLTQRTTLAMRWSSRRRRRKCCRLSASSPGDLEPVFTTMLEKAVRICDARYGSLYLREDGKLYASWPRMIRRHFAEARRGVVIKPANLKAGLTEQ